MGWRTTFDLERFTAAAEGYLRSSAAEYTVLLSAVQAACSADPGCTPDPAQLGTAAPATSAAPGGGWLSGWWEPPGGGAPRGAFLHDPAAPLLISGLVPEMAAASLAAALSKMGRTVPGIDAPTDAAAAWSQRTGTGVRVHRHCHVYRLVGPGPGVAPDAPSQAGRELPGANACPPPQLPVPLGRLRVATGGDQPLLADWLAAFEAAERIGSPRDLAAELISYGGAVFWEAPQRPASPWDAAHFLPGPRHRDAVQAREPADRSAALATLTRPVAGTVRISMLYTPPERRHGGYASALTMAVSRAVLSGATASAGCIGEIVLIADSNRPSQWATRLRYQLVSERVVLRFGPVTGTMPRTARTGPLPRLPTGAAAPAARLSPGGLVGMELAVPGLTAPVDILVDPWGVPHIYGTLAHDLFLAQGFQAATDRLWQIDTWRRRGLGLLSEAWGGKFVEQDRAARLFLFRGDMHAEWSAYPLGTEGIPTAFTAGINAYVKMTREDPALLPLEFRELGYEPSLWAPADVVRIRSHCVYFDVADEVARALVVRDFGYETEKLCRWREPWQSPTVPPGLDLSIIPDDVLRDYLLATMPAQLNPPAGSIASSGTGDGSNNWALAPTRTATGRPLLANDPHLSISLPSLRYLAHLSAPEFDVVGGGEPAVPGISAGHNGHVAFGFTMFGIDQEDLYVYETQPGRPHEYRYGERWEPMRAVRERIPVRDAQPADVDLLFTRHGPVVRVLPDKNAAFAVRAAWLCPGMAPYLGSLDYMRAQSVDQFTAALRRWGSPGENMVYADTDGNIAWKAAGLAPIRPNWDGSLPVPGDGRYEWTGFHDVDELPSEVNPARGWIATANEMSLLPDFPSGGTVGHEWQPPYRRERIGEVLEAGADFTAADMVALQGDFVSIPARRIVRQLAGRRFRNPAAARAASLLTGWDAKLARDSAAAVVFEVWYRRHLRRHLRRHALAQFLSASRVPAALAAILPADDATGDPRIDLDLIENPGQRLGPDPDRVLAEIFEVTLQDAMTEVEELLGENEHSWTWGHLHRAQLVHPASSVLNDGGCGRVTSPSLPRGGSAETVGATTYLPDFSQKSGATFRFVADVGGWDNSLAMNSPGQSGDPASPHFADLFATWAEDGAFPLLYARDQIDAVAKKRVRLIPRVRT